MGKRGPPKKPAALKKRQGNPGGRDIPDEPVFCSSDIEPPPHLDELAVEEWKRVAPGLLINGLLTDVDKAVLAVYCECYSRWCEIESLISEQKKDTLVKGYIVIGSNGNTMINPLIRASKEAKDQMIRAAKEFGMTPSSRSDVRVDANKEENPFAEIAAPVTKSRRTAH
jgi:P27 family predicted phage terminase small subunit